MNFRRIDKNTVQCILSEEEMNAYGFKIEDFFSDQEKSRDFLEQIVEKAEEEVGYHAKSGMVSMQIMKMPNNDLAITFSDRDKEDGFQNMMQQIQQLAGMIDDKTASDLVDRLHNSSQQDLSEEVSASESASMEENIAEASTKNQDKVEEKERLKKEKKRMNATKVFRFENYEKLEEFASVLIMDKPVTSTVYRDNGDGSCYLLVKKGRLKMQEYHFLCQRISEFATLSSQQIHAEQYCKEHFECFIPKQALKIICEIAAK